MTLAEMTPKRKSILWDYGNSGNARIVALRAAKLQQLEYVFKAWGPSMQVNASDGVAVLLNSTGTDIWEQCDGLTSIADIVKSLADRYEVSEEVLWEDVEKFLCECHQANIMDMGWRSVS